MDSHKPKISSETAQQWASDIYGIETKACPLPGYVDCNFRLERPDGSLSVLKIAFDEGNSSELQGQVEALRHLERGSLHSIIPRVIPDLEGRAISTASDSLERRYLVRLVSFLNGLPLAKFGAGTPQLRLETGRVLGRLDKDLMTFDHPGVHRHIVWDLARLLELRPLLEQVDPEISPLVENGLNRFEKNVHPQLDNLRSSVIHNDVNDHNILVSEDLEGNPLLSGVIDFGDILHTITVADLAIACAYLMLDCADPEAACTDVIRGYEQHLPLEPLERQLIPDLIVGRLCASLLMSAKARLKSPENQYLVVSEQPVAALLKRLS